MEYKNNELNISYLLFSTACYAIILGPTLPTPLSPYHKELHVHVYEHNKIYHSILAVLYYISPGT